MMQRRPMAGPGTAARIMGALAAVGLLLLAPAAPAGTLEAIAAREVLNCGVGRKERPGLASRDGDGLWHGLAVDYCRALAAAVLGDADAVRLVRGELAALRRGEVDVVAPVVPASLYADARGVDFPAVAFLEGYGFLVPAEAGIRSALELDGTTLCLRDATRDQEHLERFFSRHLMEPILVVLGDPAALAEAYAAGLCDAATASHRELAALRATQDPPEAHLLLPEYVAVTPLALAVAESDPTWSNAVRAVHGALLAADDAGPASGAMVAERGGGDLARALGLPPGFAGRALEAVGSYGEIFDRHLGAGSPLGLAPGLNAPWWRGGMHVAPPER